MVLFFYERCCRLISFFYGEKNFYLLCFLFAKFLKNLASEKAPFLKTARLIQHQFYTGNRIMMTRSYQSLFQVYTHNEHMQSIAALPILIIP